jgi:hypothetical protein
VGASENPVRRLWELMEERRWEEAREQLADGCRIDWPQTGERFSSADAFIGMNRAHPAPNWHVRRVRTVLEGDSCACETHVDSDEGTDVCLGFYELQDGRIATGVEYWVGERSSERPSWRDGFSELAEDER